MSRPVYDIPTDAGPGGRRGWHDVVHRSLDLTLRRAPSARAWISWKVDPAVFRLGRSIIGACVQPGDTVLDIGASWGLFTHRLSVAVGPSGTVHAFEPGTEPLASLRTVAARRGNVTVHPVALSDHEGEAELAMPVVSLGPLGTKALHPMATLTPPSHRTAELAGERVAVRRLDDVLAGAGRVSFIKCDVEGHELATLRGAQELLRRDRPPILIEIEQRHQDGPMDEVLDLLRSLGYDGWTLDGPRPRPLAEFDVQRDQIEQLQPDALYTAATPGYLHNFLFAAAGTPPERVGVGR